MEDKQRVATLTHIPRFLPEITIGAHEYDEKYYAYRSVCRHHTIILTSWSCGDRFCCMSFLISPSRHHIIHLRNVEMDTKIALPFIYMLHFSS